MFGYVEDYSYAADEDAPLLWCLAFAITNHIGKPIDQLLSGILTGGGPIGGDPGWLLYQDRIEEGRPIYHAWTNADVSGLAPCEGEYDEVVVKRHVRRILERFSVVHPARNKEVLQVIERYHL